MSERPPLHRVSLLAALAIGSLAGCGGETPVAPSPPSEAPPAVKSAPAAAPAPAVAPAPSGPAPATPEAAAVSFVTPTNGSTVKGVATDGKVSVPVRMKVEGMALEPAGAPKPGSGHHHVIVDGAPVPRDQVIPADEKHLHFGQAQSDALVPLSPGPHELTLQFADGLHRSYGPQLSATIEIRVVAAPGTAAPSPEAPAAEKPHAGH